MFLILLGVAGLLTGSGAQKPDDYRKLAGRTATVCGPIVAYSVPDSGEGCTTRLDIGAPYWRPLFYISVADEGRRRFPESPEEMYLNQEVCVTGPVLLDKKRVPFIEISAPEQIAIKVAAAKVPRLPSDALQSCERGTASLKLIREVRPNYPSMDLVSRRIEDTLLLDAVVAVDGSVAAVRTVFMVEPEFERAAHDAVKQWRFSPPERNGQPVPVIVQIEMKFRLDR